MKRHLNTLFVTTEGAYLKKDGQAVVVSIEKENKLRLPLHNLDGIVCFGNIVCSPYLICLLYTSPSPRDGLLSRMPSSA